MSRILYVITKSNFGGAQRYVHDLAVAAHQAGHEVAVAAGGDGILIEKLAAAGVDTIALRTLAQQRTFAGDLVSFGSLLELWRIIRAFRPEVVHTNSAKAGGLGALAARLAGVRHIVFTAHGWEFKGERSALSKAGIRLFSWLTILLSHRTIAVSAAVRDAVASWPFIRRRLVVIHNGIEEFPLATREEARRALSAGRPDIRSAFAHDGSLVLGTLAELTPIKGLVHGLHAIDALPEELRERTYWIICGEGVQRGVLEKEIALLGLEQRVLLAGFVPDARQYLRAFDLFLFPSLFEAMAYAVLEAGRAGLPVIASRTGGIPEIIDHAENGLLVEPRDSEGLAQAIRALAVSRAERDELGRALKEKVESAFTKDDMTRRTLAAYRR